MQNSFRWHPGSWKHRTDLQDSESKNVCVQATFSSSTLLQKSPWMWKLELLQDFLPQLSRHSSAAQCWGWTATSPKATNHQPHPQFLNLLALLSILIFDDKRVIKSSQRQEATFILTYILHSGLGAFCMLCPSYLGHPVWSWWIDFAW